MVGKAWRRREKNYLAAHGGPTRLPPPPSSKELDAIPSKLRRLMALINPADGNAASQGLPSSSAGVGKKTVEKDASKKAEKVKSKKMRHSANSETGDTSNSGQQPDDGLAETSKLEGASKRKRNQKAMDLRFEQLEELTSSSRKKKRKLHLKEKKKKKKQGKDKQEASVEFPRHEKIEFGEVVQAPPKLSFPKGLKNHMDASSQRLRLQAIENYRNQRGWTSRPGLKLPALVEKPTM